MFGFLWCTANFAGPNIYIYMGGEFELLMTFASLSVVSAN